MKKMKFLSLILAAILLLNGCGGKKPADATAPETTAAVVPETTLPETTAAAVEPVTVPAPVEDHMIETPYGALHFPGDWAPFLKTEISENPYTVAFYAVLDSREAPQKLFALSFGGKAEDAAAAVKLEDGYAAVSVIYENFAPDDSWSDGDINIVYTMQEALNTVLENLPLEDADVLMPTLPPAATASQEEASGSEALPESMQEDMAMDTPYMELHYPSKWAENLAVAVTESDVYGVSYSGVIGSHEAQHLFTVWFGGDQGISLRTIKDEAGQLVDIRVEVSEILLDDSWSEEEKSTIFAMQEDLNYLLEKMG